LDNHYAAHETLGLKVDDSTLILGYAICPFYSRFFSSMRISSSSGSSSTIGLPHLGGWKLLLGYQPNSEINFRTCPLAKSEFFRSDLGIRRMTLKVLSVRNKLRISQVAVVLLVSISLNRTLAFDSHQICQLVGLCPLGLCGEYCLSFCQFCNSERVNDPNS